VDFVLKRIRTFPEEQEMNEIHDGNRRYWDEKLAKVFQDQDEEAGAWLQCVDNP